MNQCFLAACRIFALVVAGVTGCGPIGEEGDARPGPGGGARGGAAGSSGSSGAAPTGGSGGTAGDEGGAPGDGSSGGPWDWIGIVGTGQSLSTGTPPISSTSQPYGNLKLSLEGISVPPWDSTNETFRLVPLIEPIRPLAQGFPAPYPGNIYGETPHSAMARQLTELVRTDPGGDYVTVHTVVGESGQGIVALERQSGESTGTTGRAYQATLFEAEVIARLAREAGKSYGIGAIIMTHGETDSGSSTYKDELVQMLDDYNADLAAITGQAERIPMYLSQQFAYPNGENSAGWRAMGTLVQWQLGVERPGEFVCTGPKYQYPGNGDGVHLSAAGYQMLGEKVAQVHHERAVLGRDWQPLQPTGVSRSDRVVTIEFHVPVPPLVWDETFDAPALAEWSQGRGFELRTASARLEIESVEIAGNAVEIRAASDLPASGLFAGYALSSQAVKLSVASRAARWGQLRDSDPFQGSTTGRPNPNYAVSFELPVP